MKWLEIRSLALLCLFYFSLLHPGGTSKALFSFSFSPSEECALLKRFHFQAYSTIAPYPKVPNSKGENRDEENIQVQRHFPQLLHHKVELLP